MSRPVVLVHGAFHRAQCWAPVVTLLRDQGIAVDAVELPFTGYDDDVAAVEKAIGAIAPSGGAVVCGHSLAGYILASLSSASVGHAVFLAAFMPDAGEDPMTLAQSAPPTDLAFEFGDDGTVHVTGDVARKAFFAGLDDEVVEAALAELRPMAAASVMAPPPEKPSWKDLATTYIVCEDDRAFHPELQSRLASRAREVVRVQSGHAAFLTVPDEIARVLITAARAER